jgi:hypothetical protein
MPSGAADREKRQAAALRANLKRRKAAMRARDGAAVPPSAEPVQERPNTAKKPV